MLDSVSEGGRCLRPKVDGKTSLEGNLSVERTQWDNYTSGGCSRKAPIIQKGCKSSSNSTTCHLTHYFQIMKRDGNKCLITGAYDWTAASKVMKANKTLTSNYFQEVLFCEAVHIIPHFSNEVESTTGELVSNGFLLSLGAYSSLD